MRSLDVVSGRPSLENKFGGQCTMTRYRMYRVCRWTTNVKMRSYGGRKLGDAEAFWVVGCVPRGRVFGRWRRCRRYHEGGRIIRDVVISVSTEGLIRGMTEISFRGECLLQSGEYLLWGIKYASIVGDALIGSLEVISGSESEDVALQSPSCPKTRHQLDRHVQKRDPGV